MTQIWFATSMIRGACLSPAGLAPSLPSPRQGEQPGLRGPPDRGPNAPGGPRHRAWQPAGQVTTHRHRRPSRARGGAPPLADPAAALLVMGFGGGLSEDCEVGEVVVAQEVHGPGGLRAPCTDAEALARALQDSGLKVRTGIVASLTRLAVGETRVRLREYGAVAVDMESAWLAAAAAGRPFAVVRVLSDTPTSEQTPMATLAGIARASSVLGQAAAALHAWTPGSAVT